MLQIQVKPEQRKPNIKKQEKGMAGTAQMDIRYWPLEFLLKGGTCFFMSVLDQVQSIS